MAEVEVVDSPVGGDHPERGFGEGPLPSSSTTARRRSAPAIRRWRQQELFPTALAAHQGVPVLEVFGVEADRAALVAEQLESGRG